MSVINRFNAIIGSTPNARIVSTCFAKFSIPCSRAATFSPTSAVFATPPCIFKARIVATITTALGLKPALRALMFMNFSAPKSEPNPASVITISANLRAVCVAIIELQPCAILANGPPCIIAGVPSSVCTKFGLKASFNNSVKAPSTCRSRTNTGSRSNV